MKTTKTKTKTINTTTAIAPVIKTKPPLTKQQQLFAIAASIQKQQEAAKAKHTELINEKQKQVKAAAKELITTNVSTLEVFKCEKNYYGDNAQYVTVKLPYDQKLESLLNELYKLDESWPRVRDLSVIIQQLREAERNTVNDSIVDNILNDDELVKKLADHGNSLISKHMSSRAAINI